MQYDTLKIHLLHVVCHFQLLFVFHYNGILLVFTILQYECQLRLIAFLNFRWLFKVRLFNTLISTNSFKHDLYETASTFKLNQNIFIPTRLLNNI